MLLAFLKRLLGAQPTSKKSVTKRRRLEVEMLEDRITPADTTWIGANGGAWGVAGNWSNGVPGQTDVAIFMNQGVGANTSSVMSAGAGASYHIAGLKILGGFTNTINLNKPLYVDSLQI